MEETPKKDKRQSKPGRIQSFVFAAILILLFLVVCRLFAPFFTIILWAVLLYILTNPLHQRFLDKIEAGKGRRRKKFFRSLLAAAFTLGTALLILLPLLFVVSEFVKQIMDLIRLAKDTISQKPGFMQDALEKLSSFVVEITSGQVHISAAELQARIMGELNTGLQKIVLLSSGVAKNVSVFVVSFAFLVFCLFFFYMDGAFLARLIQNAIPIRRDYIVTLVAKFKDTIKNLVLGYIIVAMVQTTLAYIVFSAFHVKGALVFAALTFIAVFIPMVGGALVWLPLGIVRILSGDIGGGIAFLAVSGVAISLLDNLLRPMFLQDRIQLHPLIIFFAIMGGLRAFGFNGLILGPMVVILFLTVLDMFLTEHHIAHGEAEEPSNPCPPPT